MSSKITRFGIILGSVILGSSLYFLFRKPPMMHALTNVKTSADAIALFPTSISQIQSRAQRALAQAHQDLEKFLAIPDEQRTFENTALALDTLAGYSDLAMNMTINQTVDLINPDEKMRAAARDAILQLSSFLIELSADKRVYNAFKAYAEGNAKKEMLSDAQKYSIAESMKDFARAGSHLPDQTLDHVKKIKKELAQLELEFEKNIANDNRKIVANAAELAGLSESFINSLQKDTEGNYSLGTDTPTYIQVMENCTNAATRKNLWNAYQNRAYPINKEVLEKIIEKRSQLADLLGFKTYAALELDSQMVGNPARAQNFLNDMHQKAQKKAEIEFKEFTKQLPESVVLSGQKKLYPWDTPFLKNYYKKTALNLDENKIAEYFPMQHTVDALLQIYKDFFNLEFKQLPAKGLWDADVQLIEVIDNANNQTMGYLFLDLFPRPGKYTHACEQTIVPTIYDQNGHPNLGVVIVVANFPKQRADKPALLKFSDVNTFFHEFGHAIHAFFGRTDLASQSGPGGVKRDFVELPSQMLEEWLWDTQILKMVSHHYQTGQPLPDDLIASILKSRTYDSGFFVVRQLLFANFSLQCFNNGPWVDLDALRKSLFDTCMKDIQYSPDDHNYASFGHLTGYGARYYGYLWSKVFAHDLFHEIKKEGLLNPEIGRRYADLVIGKGGSKDPNELLQDFLGRAPNQNAFLHDMGLE